MILMPALVLSASESRELILHKEHGGFDHKGHGGFDHKGHGGYDHKGHGGFDHKGHGGYDHKPHLPKKCHPQTITKYKTIYKDRKAEVVNQVMFAYSNIVPPYE